MHTKQKNFVQRVINKTKKGISWDYIVDAEINDEDWSGHGRAPDDNTLLN